MKKHSSNKHSIGKSAFITLLCSVGAVLAAIIGIFAVLGAKSKSRRKTCKNKNNPLERENLRDEF